MLSNNIEDVLEILKSKLNIGTDIELCKIFKVKPNTISTWKKRNTINYERLINICRENNIKLDELFNNNESEFSNKKKEDQISYVYYTNSTI